MKKVGVFWPGDYRARPNEWAKPQAASPELMTEAQVDPPSTLRRTPRPWVASSRTAGCAGEAAIDQTGRSTLPGTCEPSSAHCESAAEPTPPMRAATAAAMASPITRAAIR